MRSKHERLGPHIRELKVRNSDGACSDLRGVNIGKEFFPSVANVHGTDLSKYKRVERHQFAFNPMHVGRDEVLPIALLFEDEPVIVSPAYVVFEVRDRERLLPEYLMMWCRRPEFDRNAWFTTDNSVRGGFSWNNFYDMELPIPSIEKQREIVKEYRTVVDRIRLNEQLNEKLEEAAQAIYKQWFVEFEFPMTVEYAEAIGKPELRGQPYQSCGGEMAYNEVLEHDIPKGWKGSILGDVMELQRGFDLPVQHRRTGNVPVYAATGICGHHDIAKVAAPGVVTGRSGAIGEVMYVGEDFWPLNTTLWVKAFKMCNAAHAYFLLKSIDLLSYNSGSAVPTLNRNHVNLHEVITPPQDVMDLFSEHVEKLFQAKGRTRESVLLLGRLCEVLLRRLAIQR